VKELVTEAAVPDALMTVGLLRILEQTSSGTLELLWVIGAGLVVLVAVTVPRRAAPALAGVVLVGLLVASVVAQHELRQRTIADRALHFGSTAPGWVDAVADGPVAFFYDGNPYWTTVWQTAFWNRRIATVATPTGELPGDVPGRHVVAIRDDGLLTGSDGPLGQRLVVAPANITVDGERVRTLPLGEQFPLVLWRTPQAPTISSWATGLQPNGDIVQPVDVTVYGCGPGALELTLLGKTGAPVRISVDRQLVRTVVVRPGEVWRGSVPAPPGDPGRRCRFRIETTGLLGSTRIEFVRR
jgi:hypothetical protein